MIILAPLTVMAVDWLIVAAVGAAVAVVAGYVLYKRFSSKAKEINNSPKSREWKCNELKELINDADIDRKKKAKFISMITVSTVDDYLRKIVNLTTKYTTLSDEAFVSKLEEIFS